MMKPKPFFDLSLVTVALSLLPVKRVLSELAPSPEQLASHARFPVAPKGSNDSG